MTEGVSGLRRLLDFLADLDRASIAGQMSVARPDAVMVHVAVPGERWEVEFFDDGHVEVEVFTTSGEIAPANKLDDLFERFGDETD